MSMQKDHAQSLADKIAMDEYGEAFPDLPLSVQNDLLKRGGELANEQLMTRNDKERAFYENITNWDT